MLAATLLAGLRRDLCSGHPPVKEEWQQLLASRKRAFKKLRSKEVTAYKKRRTADRNRVIKKFFLDNDLPAPEEPADVAPNDCGTAAPTVSERARFVELWCKLGSWGICKDCRSIQPRPLEPMDTSSARLLGRPAPLLQRCCVECLAPFVRDPHHGRVVDVGALFVHFPESLQGPRDVATPADRLASFRHPCMVAEDAPVLLSAVAPRRPPRIGGREEARQGGREAAAERWHDQGGLRCKDCYDTDFRLLRRAEEMHNFMGADYSRLN